MGFNFLNRLHSVTIRGSGCSRVWRSDPLCTAAAIRASDWKLSRLFLDYKTTSSVKQLGEKPLDILKVCKSILKAVQ